jgi:hypothetical protein
MALKVQIAFSLFVLSGLIFNAIDGSAECTSWRTIKSGNRCLTTAAKICNISLSELHSYNPTLQPGNTCGSLQPGMQFCCRRSASARADLLETSSANSAQIPLRLFKTSTCASIRTVRSGDTCYLSARICRISRDELYRLNQQLKDGTQCSSLTAGMQLCCKGNGD